MKKRGERRRSIESKSTDDLNCEFDSGTREALSKHLHEALNSLWPASVQIELSISEETCPPTFRKTLEELGQHVAEAMSIVAQANELIHSPIRERARP